MTVEDIKQIRDGVLLLSVDLTNQKEADVIVMFNRPGKVEKLFANAEAKIVTREAFEKHPLPVCPLVLCNDCLSGKEDLKVDLVIIFPQDLRKLRNRQVKHLRTLKGDGSILIVETHCEGQVTSIGELDV